MSALLRDDVSDRRGKPSTRLGILSEPMGYVDGVNRYEFVGDDPTGKVDPSGLAGQATTGPTSPPTTGPTSPPTTGPTNPVPITTITLPNGTEVVVRMPPGAQSPSQPPATLPVMPIGQEAQGQLTRLRLWGDIFASADVPWSKDNQCDMQAANLMNYLRDVYKDEKPKLWDIQSVGGSSTLTNHNLVVLKPINGNPLPPMTLDSFHGPQNPFDARRCKVGTLKDFQKDYPNPVRKGK